MRIYISGDIRCGVNGFKVMILMQDGSVTDTDGDIIGKAVEVPPCGRLGDLDDLSTKVADAREAARQQWRDSFSRIPLTGDAYEEGRMDGLADAIDLLGAAETIIPADPAEAARKEADNGN